jgi:raffinose/stachyose/melibiose transport system substrate-binding protein
LILLVAILAACAPAPTPAVVEKIVTQVVKETVIVEVEGTPQVVEKEVVVTATPGPVEEVDLEVWYLSGSPEEIQLVEGLSNTFAEKHPGVTVTLSAYGFDEMNKTIKLALDSGTGPDVAYVSPGAGAGHISYAQAGHLVELTDIVTERGWDQRHPMDAIMYWQKELGGPIWGVPYDVTNVGVFYNKNIFDELGLNPPQTFEEFETLLANLKDQGYTPFSVGALDGWPFDHYFGILVHVTVPIEKIEALNYLQPGVSFTEDGFVQAATVLNDWIGKGYFNDNFLAASYQDQNNLFITGETAMNIGGTWNNATFVQQADFEVGFFPVPKVNPDIAWHSMVTPNNVWIVPKYSEHQELALDYIDYMLSGEVARALWDSGDIPTFDFATLPEATSGLQADVYQAGLDTGIGYYFTNNMPEAMETEWSALQLMASGDLTPQEAMEMIEEAHAKAVAEAQ